jgi:hypothetical protein
MSSEKDDCKLCLGREDVQRILSAAVEDLRELGEDYMLSMELTLDDCMTALDLQNVRMDRATVLIDGSTPLFEYREERVNYEDPRIIQHTLNILVRAVATWQTGTRSVLDTLVPLQAVRLHIRRPQLSDLDNVESTTRSIVRTAVLGAWRCIDLCVDFASCATAVVVKSDEFGLNLHGLLPLEATRQHNGVVIADLQDWEFGLGVSDPSRRYLRFLKLWCMWLTTWLFKAPMTEQLRLELAKMIQDLPSDNPPFICTDDSEANKDKEMGWNPLLCNLHFVGCPRTRFEPILSLPEAMRFCGQVVEDVERNLLMAREPWEWRFQTTLGRIIVAQQLLGTTPPSSLALFSSLPRTVESKEERFLKELMLMSPARQWRLLKKQPRLAPRLALFWIRLGEQLNLLDPWELVEAEQWRQYIQSQSSTNPDLDAPALPLLQDHPEVSPELNVLRFRHRWQPLLASFSNS